MRADFVIGAQAVLELILRHCLLKKMWHEA